MAKKQDNRLEAARDAVTGYVAVVLGITCFILLLVLVTAAVRLIAELGPVSGATAAATSTPVATATASASTSTSTAAAASAHAPVADRIPAAGFGNVTLPGLSKVG